MLTTSRVPAPRWKREAELVMGRGVTSHLQSRRELPVDKVLLAVVLGITLFGAVMVYSASAILAEKNYGSQFYFLSRQALWALAGLGAMAVGLAIDYRHYKRPVVIYSALFVTLVMLIVVLFLPRVNETHRWIRYGSFSLQPSEPAKLALIAFLGFFLEKHLREIDSFKHTFVRAAVVAGVLIGLVGAEPDLGTAMALGLVFVTMMFQAGTPIAVLCHSGRTGGARDHLHAYEAVAIREAFGVSGPVEIPNDIWVPTGSVDDRNRKRRCGRRGVRAGKAEAFLFAGAAYRFYFCGDWRGAWADRGGNAGSAVWVAGVARLSRGSICPGYVWTVAGGWFDNDDHRSGVL